MQKHILYSFRRCPYAIRARWGIKRCNISVELREVDLKNKPLDIINKSTDKTVPLLILNSGEVIQESLDIIFWALSNSSKSEINKYFQNNRRQEILNLIKENDNKFKFHLDRFKYSSRFDEKEKEFHFEEAQKFIYKLNNIITLNSRENYWLIGEEESVADWSIWPFVRQFKIACLSQKKSNYFPIPITSWLAFFEKSITFKEVMYKYKLWDRSIKFNFPIN